MEFQLDWLTAWVERPPIGWRDLLDIAIVSVLIYEVLKLIRGTRAAQMALGAALLAGLLFISQIADLQTVNWLIRNMVGYIVFAAIVLFQSDIRRALAHLGRAPFFRLLERSDTADEAVEEIVVAASMLANQQVGAIIAIEREIGLRNYIEGGIPLDAKVTYDLIVAIFQPTSPLHDGAIIVQEERIAAAACFLPLTVNPRLSRELGSRHRAAIGLTEENDAVAVVVSEETGIISLVHRGPHRARADAGGPPRPPAPARGTASRRVRAASAGTPSADVATPVHAPRAEDRGGELAMLLWFVIAGQKQAERSLRVPLEFQNTPEHLELTSDPPEYVDVRVRGPARALGAAAQRRSRGARGPRTTPGPGAACSTSPRSTSTCRRACGCCRCSRPPSPCSSSPR
jgi:diadenylate cyclase